LKAEIKDIFSPDIEDLENYHGSGSFRFLVQISIGPENEDAQEIFDVTVCSPAGLEEYINDDVINGRHMVFLKEFTYKKFINFIEKTFLIYEENNWSDLANKIARYGQWEFEDYKG